MTAPKPLRDLDPGKPVQILFFDIDDTFTSHGRVRSEAFAALEDWQAAGRLAVAVTGRPAGWCDHFARMWPIHSVIGENGAFWFSYQPDSRRLDRVFLSEFAPGDALRAKLDQVQERVLADFPRARIASDQAYRLYDLAIDFAEDVIPPLPLHEADQIAAKMQSMGMTAKVSSIHVNGWFGQHNKYQACVEWLARVVGLTEVQAHPACVYVGDSLNDEPMFAKFPFSVGVANVAPFLSQMSTPPGYITTSDGADGFCELVGHLLGNPPKG
jgi:HAD superfamily hydrolase (TIGR01484 family)